MVVADDHTVMIEKLNINVDISPSWY